MVQKSGYFSRSAPANETDLALIREMAELAVACALEGTPGVIGHDEERGDELRAIEFERIAGHKPFDADAGLVHRAAARDRPGLTPRHSGAGVRLRALGDAQARRRAGRAAASGGTPRWRARPPSAPTTAWSARGRAAT